MDQKTHRFGIVEQSHIFFRLLLSPPFALSLSYDASEFLKSLPPYSQATRDQWNEFFSFFGTHYVRGVDLGGRARLDILHDTKRWMKNDTDYVKTQFGFKFRYGLQPLFFVLILTPNQTVLAPLPRATSPGLRALLMTPPLEFPSVFQFPPVSDPPDLVIFVDPICSC